MHLIPLLLLLLLCTGGHAQRVLLFENLRKDKVDRLYEGDRIKFRMLGDDFWQTGPIRQMRPDIQALVINDRFIMLDEIETVNRGSTFGKAAGYSLMTFGVTYTTIGLIGYNTDGDSGTQISTAELGVGLGSVAVGYLVNRLFGTKKYRLGPTKKLRIIDTTF